MKYKFTIRKQKTSVDRPSGTQIWLLISENNHLVGQTAEHKEHWRE